MSTLKGRLVVLNKLCDEQVEAAEIAAGDEYMRGLANGLILAVATMEDCEPVFLELREPRLEISTVKYGTRIDNR